MGRRFELLVEKILGRSKGLVATGTRQEDFNVEERKENSTEIRNEKKSEIKTPVKATKKVSKKATDVQANKKSKIKTPVKATEKANNKATDAQANKKSEIKTPVKATEKANNEATDVQTVVSKSPEQDVDTSFKLPIRGKRRRNSLKALRRTSMKATAFNNNN